MLSRSAHRVVDEFLERVLESATPLVAKKRSRRVGAAAIAHATARAPGGEPGGDRAAEQPRTAARSAWRKATDRAPPTAPTPPIANSHPNPEASRPSASRATIGSKVEYGMASKLISAAIARRAVMRGRSRTYPTPATILCHTGALFGMGLERARISISATIAPRYDSVLTPKQPASPIAPSVRPATLGPTIRDRLN